MKSNSFGVLAAAALLGCTMNSSAPVTAWGKKDVSMTDYRNDAGQCAIIAAQANMSGSGAESQRAPGSSDSAAQSAAQPAITGGSGSEAMGSGTYRDSAPADYVNRAAMQQRQREMNEQRARQDRLKGCLVSRGYSEIDLTAEQRKQLDKLPQGSDERREYLYKLGTDPNVLKNQVRNPTPEPAKSGS